MKTSKTKVISLIALYSVITACNSGNSNSTSSHQSSVAQSNNKTTKSQAMNTKTNSNNSLSLDYKSDHQQNMNLHGITISNDNSHIYHVTRAMLVEQELNDDGIINEHENILLNNSAYDEIKGVALTPDNNYISIIMEDDHDRDDVHSINMFKKNHNGKPTYIYHDIIKAVPTGIVISPDGKNAYMSSEYHSFFGSIGYIYWYSINSDGTMKYKNKVELEDSQKGIAISPNNKFIYSATGGGFINQYMIDNKDGSFKYIKHYKQGGHLSSIAISADNQYIFVGSTDPNIEVYHIHEDGSLSFYSEFRTENSTVALSVSPNNKYLYAVDSENIIHTYSITDNHCNNAPAPNVNWYGCNKSFQNLSNYDLSHANLSYANLHGANLTNTNLSNANLYKANLNNAILDNTNFSGSKIINTSFNTANFKNNNFNDTIIDNSFFNEANLQNISFKNAKLKHNNFILADLENANLDNLSLVDTNFSQANLINTSFVKTNLAKSNFTLAKLISTDFTSADLSKSNGLDLITIEDIGKAFTTKLIKANLRDAHIVDDKINFCGENKTYLSLDEADLDGLTLGNNKKCSDNSIGCCKIK